MVIKLHIYGYYGGTDFFPCFRFYASFFPQNHFQILVIFELYTLEETVIEKAVYIQMSVMNRGIRCNSGTSFMGLAPSQSMQDLASLMRKGRTFLIPDDNSCIDCEPHKG